MRELSRIAVITVVLMAFMVSGGYLGVQKYKRGCERLENASQTESWLECDV